MKPILQPMKILTLRRVGVNVNNPAYIKSSHIPGRTIPKALSKLIDRIYADGGEVEKNLRAKCKWEHMSPAAVLMEWPGIIAGTKYEADMKSCQRNMEHESS